MTKQRAKKSICRKGGGKSLKEQPDLSRSLASESVGNLIHLHKLQGVLLTKLQKQIKQIKTR